MFGKSFLGLFFAKLWKETIRFIMSVCSSIYLCVCVCVCVIISHWILLWMRNVSDKICRENEKPHFMFSNFFLKIVRFMR
jgi:hypothetical protein